MSAELPIGMYEKAPAVVNEWDTRSFVVAERIAALIHERLPELTPEHIGSTAVPGCAGKGIIDLMIPFTPDQLQSIQDALEALGFQRQTGPDPWPEDRPMRVGSIQHDGTTYRIHVHVVPADSPEVTINRKFRDDLRADPALVDEYVSQKRSIAGTEGIDSYNYAVAKGEWVSALLAVETDDLNNTAAIETAAAPSQPPTARSSKAALLDRMEQGRAEWERLLVQVGEARMEVAVDDSGWTAKDIVAHVMTYERWTAAMIMSGLRGSPATAPELYDEDEPPPGFDTWDMHARNAAVLAYYRDHSFADIIASAERAFTALIDAVQGVSDEQIVDPDAFEWTGGKTLLELIPEQSFDHYAAHAPVLRALAES